MGSGVFAQHGSAVYRADPGGQAGAAGAIHPDVGVAEDQTHGVDQPRDRDDEDEQQDRQGSRGRVRMEEGHEPHPDGQRPEGEQGEGRDAQPQRVPPRVAR